ncbi:MAG TPA: DUF2007 domain-containing protein [Bacillota bacterium]|nr:DUF2007 domain-containing protein [Bacillota bacterium]HUM56440.1 DUF2007 domain-containing protein [Bacillota bacterium]
MKEDNGKKWREGVYLCTCESSLKADIIESKLRSEGVPCLKKYKGASNFIEIAMGNTTAFPIDIYVREETLEDARNIIVAVPIDEDFKETEE